MAVDLFSLGDGSCDLFIYINEGEERKVYITLHHYESGRESFPRLASLKEISMKNPEVYNGEVFKFINSSYVRDSIAKISNIYITNLALPMVCCGDFIDRSLNQSLLRITEYNAWIIEDVMETDLVPVIKAITEEIVGKIDVFYMFPQS